MVVDHPAIEQRLRTVASETLDGDVDWTVEQTSDGWRLALPDRVLDISQCDGPTETVRWVLTLEADGAIVSKFGPYESTDDLVDQLKTVLTSDVFYTVCCDG
jgi:hypothetical protein